MLNIHCDMTNVTQFEAELDRINKYGIPNAVRTSLSTAASETVEFCRENLGAKFTLRNTYTARSIVSDRATQRDIRDMQSAAGSLQAYMAQQEEGFSHEATGKYGVAIPTPASSGEVTGVSKRLKTMLRKNYLRNLNPISAHSMANPMGPNFNKGRGGVALAARAAIEEGSRVIFIDRRRDHYHRKTGFYRVMGGHLKNPHQRGLYPAGARLRLLYSLDKRHTVVKSHEWLRESARIKAENIDNYYIDALEKELAKGKFR
jgi:hypothetical protein